MSKSRRANPGLIGFVLLTTLGYVAVSVALNPNYDLFLKAFFVLYFFVMSFLVFVFEPMGDEEERKAGVSSHA